MVLENSSVNEGAGEDFLDQAPTSDTDPYSSSSLPSRLNYNIDVSQFPKPLPIIGPLMGYNTEFLNDHISKKIAKANQVLKRPPTLEEATALAYHDAKQIAILSYGTPLGVAAGAYRWYATRDTFKFPFMKATTELVNLEAWPHARVALFRGNRAVMAWQAMRFLSYAAFGDFISRILFASYSVSVQAVGHMSDPRLKDYIKAVREDYNQKNGGIPNASVGAPAGRSRQNPEPRQNQNAPIASAQQSVDDASPTGGMFFEKVTATGEDTHEMDDGRAYQPTPPQNPQVKTPPRRQWPNRSPVQQQPQQNEDVPFAGFDDASPSADLSTQPNAQPQPSGSVWERIRSGRKPQQSPSPRQGSSWPTQTGNQESNSGSAWSKQRQRSISPSEEDGFNALRSEEERRYSREEAQRDFDAQVEKERKGGDFGGGIPPHKTDQKRW